MKLARNELLRVRDCGNGVYFQLVMHDPSADHYTTYQKEEMLLDSKLIRLRESNHLRNGLEELLQHLRWCCLAGIAYHRGPSFTPNDVRKQFCCFDQTAYDDGNWHRHTFEKRGDIA